MTSALNHRYPTVQGEFETELETETEDEFEDESEDELELEDEFEDEGEDFQGEEFQGEDFQGEDFQGADFQGADFQGEEFLSALGGIARGVGSLLGEGEEETEFEFEFEFEAEAEVEGEMELEDEDEAFVNPVQRIYRDAELMAHLARNAATAEGEEEAEAFIGALVPIAARLIPRAASLVARNAPALIRGAARIARKLRRDPATRRLVQAMPVVLQRTAQSLADQAATGRPVTAESAVRTLARMTGRVLGSPHSCQRALGAVGVFDRRYRRRAATRRIPGNGAIGQGGRAGGPAYGRRRRVAGNRRSSGAVSRARRPR